MTSAPTDRGRTTFLIVSADPERREAWAGFIEADGARVLRCAGPTVSCTLLRGDECPLLREADVGVYDRDALTPRFLRVLPRARPLPPLFAVHDDTRDGGHRPGGPVRMLARGEGLCFGEL